MRDIDFSGSMRVMAFSLVLRRLRPNQTRQDDYCYYKLGKKIQARQAYRQALKLEPDNQRIKNSLQRLK